MRNRPTSHENLLSPSSEAKKITTCNLCVMKKTTIKGIKQGSNRKKI